MKQEELIDCLTWIIRTSRKFWI